MLPALEATLARPRHRPRRAGERPPRPRAAPGQEPARVLRADRGAGPRDARDPADRRPRRLGGALPRGRPHRALRAHLRRPADGGEAARRHGGHRGLGDAARSTSSPSRRGSTGASTCRASSSSRTRARSRSSTSSRRYCAKLLYEIEFFQADDPAHDAAALRRAADRRAEAARRTPESYLDDIDGSFYVTGYLRSWAFEAQLRDFLRSEFGNEWFARREAGGLLRELWSLGQGPTADELLARRHRRASSRWPRSPSASARGSSSRSRAARARSRSRRRRSARRSRCRDGGASGWAGR